MRAFIVGAGAQGRMIADILKVTGEYESIAFFDERREFHGEHVDGVPVLGGVCDALLADPAHVRMIAGIGRNTARTHLAEFIQERGFELLNAIHPSAAILPSARIGVGNMIAANCVINTGARIGDNVILNAHTHVEHDTLVDDGVLAGPRVTLGGRVIAGKEAFLGMSSTVLIRLTVGAGAVVAGGALVTRDVPERVFVMGSPARECGTVDGSFRWDRFF